MPPAPDFADLLVSVAERPGVYGLDSSYKMFVAFVHGYDWGSGHRALDGLLGWLDGQHGPQRLAWEQQVLATAFPGRSPLEYPESFDDNRWATDAAVVMLRQFLADR
jgi:hypothetical protein